MLQITMGCPPVRGDNQRALASGLAYVQVDRHCITSIPSKSAQTLHIMRYFVLMFVRMV